MIRLTFFGGPDDGNDQRVNVWPEGATRLALAGHDDGFYELDTVISGAVAGVILFRWRSTVAPRFVR